MSLSLGIAAILPAQSPVPIRELSAPTASTTDHFGTVLGVRPLSDGRVLVDDGRSRQLVILDRNLSHRVVLLDSLAKAQGGLSYGTRASPLIPYLKDTILFADWSSLALNVISPSGELVRTMSAPKPSDVRNMINSQGGIDAKGSLVYLGSQQMLRIKGEFVSSDSGPVVRANFDSRTVDTLAQVLRYGGSRNIREFIGGDSVNVLLRNPLRWIDEWGVLSDGTVMLVRGHDYHVDIFPLNGKSFSGPKLPFDWKRLTDADKQGLIDSARTEREASERDPNAMPDVMSVTALMAAQRSGERPTNANQPKPHICEVPITEISDYWPPIRRGAARADLDNNLWILPTTSAQAKNGELIYDVVNNKGEMKERVRIPEGRAIAGFGRNGVVYLMHREGNSGWIIERTTILEKARQL